MINSLSQHDKKHTTTTKKLDEVTAFYQHFIFVLTAVVAAENAHED